MTRQPNTLWIVLDQFRFNTPGFNGNTICHTPNMDRLAASGVNFRRAYTPCSLCAPIDRSLGKSGERSLASVTILRR